jgi:hypothetical protein
MDQHDPEHRERHLRLLSDADLDRIMKARETGGNVNMLHPLEVFLDRGYLTDVVRTSLAALRTRDTRLETREQQVAAESAIHQRLDMLSWLSGQPERVYMAMYPADDDGLDDLDDLTEFLDSDDTGDLPF